MRVCVVDQSGSLGGAQLALLNTVPYLADRPDVVLFESGPLEAKLKAKGVNVVSLGTNAQMGKSFVGSHMMAQVIYVIRNLFTLISLVLQLRRTLVVGRYDVVHSNTMKAHVLVSLARIGLMSKHVVHVREQISPRYMSTLPRLLMAVVCRFSADAIIANSESTLATVPTSKSAIARVVVYSPIQIPDLSRRRSVLGEGPLTVVSLSRLAPWKGQLLIVQAFERLVHHGVDAQLIIAGGPQFGEYAYEAELGRAVQASNFAHRIRLTGHVDDIWTLLEDADIVVHASLIPEPLGQVVMQGLAAGCLVIAPAEGGPAELIRHGETGLLYAPTDVDSLTATLIWAADRRGDSRLIALAGVSGTDAFAPEIIAPKLAEIYVGVTARTT